MIETIKKINVALVVAMLAFLQGCGTFYRPTATAFVNCKGAQQCNELWSNAQSWIALNGDYKIQNQSDSFLQTYGPLEENIAGMAFTITKTVDQDGNGKILIRTSCPPTVYGCVYDPSIAANKLYYHLNPEGK